MRSGLALLLLVAAVQTVDAQSRAATVKLLRGCEIDLNGDGKPDMAMSLRSSGTSKLVVLLAKGKDYESFVLKTGYPAGMVLKCARGSTVRETAVALNPGEKARTLKTPGAYVELTQPEGASVAYVWTGDKFTEVWTSD